MGMHEGAQVEDLQTRRGRVEVERDGGLDTGSVGGTGKTEIFNRRDDMGDVKKNINAIQAARKTMWDALHGVTGEAFCANIP